MLIPDSNKKRIAFNKKFISEYKEFCEMLDQKYPDINSYGEKYYLYINNLQEQPKCPICGNPCKFVNVSYGYILTCHDKKCIKEARSTTISSLMKEAFIKKYGVDNPMKTKAVQDKAKETNQQRYGGNSPHCSKEVQEKQKKTCRELYGGVGFASKGLNRKAKQTTLERYGDENITRTEYGRQKINNTNMSRYGVPWTFQSYEQIKKTHEVMMERYGVKNIRQHHALQNHEDLIEILDDGTWVCKCLWPECNKCEEKTFYTNGKIHQARKCVDCILCTKINPIKKQKIAGTSIELIIRNILDKHNIHHEDNLRTLIPPKEIDIYLPEYKIGIECNGERFHKKNSEAEKIKEQMCGEAGIKLLVFWETDIKKRTKVIERFLLYYIKKQQQ